jgi:3-oxoacyl-[acyl-carrier protein] reductase
MAFEIDFSGKIALVVGGASGIGNGIAQGLRANGADVHIWGTRPSGDAYADEPTSNLEGLHYYAMDATDDTAVAGWKAPFERLDILVLCQGAVLYKRREFEIDGFRRVVDVNLNSVMACAIKFRPALASSGGSLIIVSSAAAYYAPIGNPAYGASKTGAEGLTRALAAAWAGEGIRVNGIAPGFVPTRLTKVTIENEGRSQATLARIPLGRFGSVEDMAGVAMFLASPLAAYVVGQTILVDGGLLLQ